MTTPSALPTEEQLIAELAELFYAQDYGFDPVGAGTGPAEPSPYYRNMAQWAVNHLVANYDWPVPSPPLGRPDLSPQPVGST